MPGRVKMFFEIIVVPVAGSLQFSVVLDSGLGILTCLIRKGSETGFLAKNLDRQLDRAFQGQISDRKAEPACKTSTGY